MKKILGLICLLTGITHCAYGVPEYYTFQGEIWRSDVSGYSVGQVVTYIFMIDRDRIGIHPNNILENKIAYGTNNAFYDIYYYCDYIYGPGYIEGEVNPENHDVFWSYNTDPARQDGALSINGDSLDASMNIELPRAWFKPERSDWDAMMSAGDRFSGRQSVYEDGTYVATVFSHLYVVGRSYMNPTESATAIPEPMSILLMGVSLIMLWRRKRRG